MLIVCLHVCIKIDIFMQIWSSNEKLEQSDSDKGPRIMPCSFGDNLDYC